MIIKFLFWISILVLLTTLPVVIQSFLNFKIKKKLQLVDSLCFYALMLSLAYILAYLF